MTIREEYQRHEWWSHDELADYAGVKKGTVYRWVSDGKITSRSHTNHRINRDEAMRFLEEDHDGRRP